MSGFRQAQTSFAMGEISPDAAARIDLDEFKQSVGFLQNFIPTPTGGAKKRPGTIFEREIPDSFTIYDTNGGPALIPFIASKEEAYIIAIRNTNNESGGDSHVQIFKNDDAKSLIPTDLGAFFFTYPHDIPTSTDPRGYSYAQSGSLLFVAHRSGTVPPFVVTRLAENSFRVADIENATTAALPGPILPTAIRYPYRKNFSATTLTPSATSGTPTITASSGIFTADHVGAFIKLTQGNKTGVAKITTFTSTTQVTVTIQDNGRGTPLDFNDLTPSDIWHISEWSDEDGWPTAVSIFEERIVWGGSSKKPDLLFFSLAGNLFHLMEERLEQDKGSSDVSKINYFGDTTASDPFTKLLGSKEINNISWINSSNSLLVGTLGAEYIVSVSDDGTFDGGTAPVKQQSSHGSKFNKSVRVGERVLFLNRDGKKVRDLKFNTRNGSHISQDMTLLNTQIHRHGDLNIVDDYPLVFDSGYNSDEFKDMHYQTSRESVWCLTSKNDITSMTLHPETQGIAWARHILGGTNVNVWGVTSVPNKSAEWDDLYIVVERFIDSTKKWSLERIGKDFDSDTLDNSTLAATFDENTAIYEVLQPIYLDAAHKSIASSASTIISGLGYLEGESVSITVNGTKSGPDLVVAAGAVTLATQYESGDVLCVGLPYEAEMQLHDPEAGGEKGEAEGAKKKLDRIDINVFRTFKLKTGIVGGRFDINVPFDTKDVEDGIHRAQIGSSPKNSIKAFVKSDEPYPATILSVTLRGSTYD